jgi:Uncharacterised protein family (UPF0158)
MISVNFGDLETAVEFVSSSMLTEHRAYISIDTGVIYWVSASGDIDEDVPEDLGESDRYIDVPTKNDLDLGRRLALRFAEEHMPNDSETVWQYFAHRGAYARFKDLLEARGQLDAWYAFDAECTQRAILEWCEAHDIKAIRENEASRDASA